MKDIRRKLLVVEDCQSDVFLLERMLDEAGNTTIDITSVPRLFDAFQRIDKEIFDAILLDLNLLDMDGVASVAALNAQVPDIPILVYSGTESKRTKQEALLCGARGYLIKGRENGESLQHAITNVIACGEALKQHETGG